MTTKQVNYLNNTIADDIHQRVRLYSTGSQDNDLNRMTTTTTTTFPLSEAGNFITATTKRWNQQNSPPHVLLVDLMDQRMLGSTNLLNSDTVCSRQQADRNLAIAMQGLEQMQTSLRIDPMKLSRRGSSWSELKSESPLDLTTHAPSPTSTVPVNDDDQVFQRSGNFPTGLPSSLPLNHSSRLTVSRSQAETHPILHFVDAANTDLDVISCFQSHLFPRRSNDTFWESDNPEVASKRRMNHLPDLCERDSIHQNNARDRLRAHLEKRQDARSSSSNSIMTTTAITSSSSISDRSNLNRLIASIEAGGRKFDAQNRYPGLRKDSISAQEKQVMFQLENTNSTGEITNETMSSENASPVDHLTDFPRQQAASVSHVLPDLTYLLGIQRSGTSPETVSSSFTSTRHPRGQQLNEPPPSSGHSLSLTVGRSHKADDVGQRFRRCVPAEAVLLTGTESPSTRDDERGIRADRNLEVCSPDQSIDSADKTPHASDHHPSLIIPFAGRTGDDRVTNVSATLAETASEVDGCQLAVKSSSSKPKDNSTRQFNNGSHKLSEHSGGIREGREYQGVGRTGNSPNALGDERMGNSSEVLGLVRMGNSPEAPTSTFDVIYQEHSNNKDANDTNSSNTKSTESSKPCKICEDVANGFHYGVWSCEGCKAFFKRSITGSARYVCPADNNCTINRLRKKSCQACRLRKCFGFGMSAGNGRGENGSKVGRKRKLEKTNLQPPATYDGSVDAASSKHVSSLGWSNITTTTGDTVSNGNGLAKDRPYCFPQSPIQPTLMVEHVQEPDNQSILENLMTFERPIRYADCDATYPDSWLQLLGSVINLINNQLMDIVTWSFRMPVFINMSTQVRTKLLVSSWSEILLMTNIYYSTLYTNVYVMAPNLHLTRDHCEMIGMLDLYNRLMPIIKVFQQLELTNAEMLLLQAIILINSQFLSSQSLPGFDEFRRKLIRAWHQTSMAASARSYGSSDGGSERVTRLMLMLPEIRHCSIIFLRILNDFRRDNRIPFCSLLQEVMDSQLELDQQVNAGIERVAVAGDL